MITDIIDENLLKEIRLITIGTLTFNGQSTDIIKKEFLHNSLITNFDIPENILNYYCSPCRDMLTDKDYEKLKDNGYIGNPERILKPYPFCFNGSFIPRKMLFYQLSEIMNNNYSYNRKPIKKMHDLFPYFEDYSLGFKKGYESFEDICITPYLPMFSDKTDYINKVFEYITKEIIFKHSWVNNHFGFTITLEFDKGNISDERNITKAFENGQFQGYFYKAWTLVFSNVKLYENLFDIFFKKKNHELISEKNKIITDLLLAAHTMQQNFLFAKADEDTRTKQILDLLPKIYNANDQSTYGSSTVGKRAGSVDGVFSFNNIEYFIEAFNLTSLNRSIIKLHIDKLENNYDTKGLKEKFIIIYYNLETNTFGKAADKYKKYITSEHEFIYPSIENIEEITMEYTDSRMFKTYHNREGNKVTLYHILLKFSKQA
jgi:hypothetical protein